MTLPSETEAGSAGRQPCRGITWWAHRDDVQGRGTHRSRSYPNRIGSVDPHALKIPARRAEYSLTGNAHPPFHAEPEHVPKHRHRPKTGSNSKPCPRAGTHAGAGAIDTRFGADKRSRSGWLADRLCAVVHLLLRRATVERPIPSSHRSGLYRSVCSASARKVDDALPVKEDADFSNTL
jgi:hypothetical protein